MIFEYIKKHQKRVIIGLIILVALFLLLFDFSRFTSIIDWVLTVFEPLIIGGCIAFTLNLLMSGLNRLIFDRIHFKKEGLKNSLALLTSVLLLIVIVLVLLWFVIPQLIQSFQLLLDSIPGALDYLRKLFNSVLDRYPVIEKNIQAIPFNTQNIAQSAVSYVQRIMSSTFDRTYNFATNTIGLIFTIFVSIMFSFFLLLYKSKLGRQCRQLLYTYLKPTTANQVLYIFHLAYKNFSAFIYGQVLGALIDFAMYLAISLIFRIPYALMISVMIMIFSLIPMFGSYIAYIIGLLLVLSADPIKAIYFSIIFFVVCNVEGNLIYPRIIGSSIGLPGIWVLAAVTVGANMFGVVGMIFSVPIVALLYTLLSENSQKILAGKPEVIDSITHIPKWSYYNYQTREFQEDPVVIKNVLDNTEPDSSEDSKSK